MTVCLNSIWEEFSIPIRNFIRQRVSNEHDGEDILQEVFLKIHKGIDGLKERDKIHPWIYRITRNAITDYYRKCGKSDISLEFLEDIIDEPDEDLSSNSEIAKCLKSMINSLPDKYKEAILLTEFQSLTQKELSRKLGLSISGAKSRVQRTRGMLKEMLLDCCKLEFDRVGNIIEFGHKSSECKYC